jgi:Tol biopolymer transport system component
MLPTLNVGANNSPTFSPDGRILAHTSGQLRTDVVLVNLRNGRPAWTLETHATVLTIAFTPDGKRLVTGHSNGHVGLWDADVESWPRYACRIANRNLTREEWKALVAEEVPFEVLCPEFAVAAR